MESSGPSLPTPIGTFSLAADVSFPDRHTLTVVAGNRRHVYDLGRRRYEVRLPNDRAGLSRVAYDGRGNITVTVPDPVWNTH